MVRTYRVLVAILAVAGAIAIVGPAYAKAKGKAHPHHQHSGQQLLGNRIKIHGNHVIDKVGKNTVTVVVTDGKVAGVKVKHSEKGAVPVKKYKTTQKMAMGDGTTFASYNPTLLAQSQDLGTVWIGYSFVDDYGDEEIYWFPYAMIYDGDTGAIFYVPYSSY
jgi:hypothetical protein